ncbi:mannitol dehydrogenase [Azorhizobium oxalatiphilum]|uniref:Mannitol dehydrogenase n=1 Tax=Azorhizobium oxalatiphilum TaxID=980631 RepID=A0A917C3G7_9HYPH|nr:mannitol dehydrogenase family protein [Azorhizobium oxalatiphilum]GGF66257.1 mannitol dehydrogenase [Azorhizobium oxalatiphilum]
MRLSLSSLNGLPADVRRPAYDVANAEIGVVHLGVGAFHRAHQAVYLDDCLGLGATGWAVCGASLRSPDTSQALDPQDGLYTLATRSGSGDELRIIGSLRRLLVAPSNPKALLDAMSDPGVRIVTLTVTEKGYCHDPATGTLDEAHPDIVADLANPSAPRTAPGYLVEALARRKAAGTPPFTVLCCDNLPSNGATVARVVGHLASLRDPDLGRWVEGEVAFPSTMVDRIVPATTDADKAMVSSRLGVDDHWPVMTEPFSQWVIEDRFPTGRPPLEDVGAELVKDVRPYEDMKLRLLNGSHSTLAYLGYLAGHETIAGTMAESAFQLLVERLQDQEVTPTVPAPPGADLAAYKRALRARFANPALRHRTWQIAMDGSQKLPQRLLAPIRDRLAAGAPIALLSLGVAGWMRYVSGTDEHGQAIDVRDPLAERFRQVAHTAGPDAERLADGLLAIREVFGTDLPADPRFTGAVKAALAGLYREGAAATVRRAVAG